MTTRRCSTGDRERGSMRRGWSWGRTLGSRACLTPSERREPRGEQGECHVSGEVFFVFSRLVEHGTEAVHRRRGGCGGGRSCRPTRTARGRDEGRGASIERPRLPYRHALGVANDSSASTERWAGVQEAGSGAARRVAWGSLGALWDSHGGMRGSLRRLTATGWLRKIDGRTGLTERLVDEHSEGRASPQT